MKKETKVLIENYQGFEISVDTNTSRFRAENKKLDLIFESTDIWSLKNRIHELKWIEPKNKKAIIIWPTYDNNRLAKITIIKENTATKEVEFLIEDVTDVNPHDVGKKKTEIHLKLYQMNENNLKIWDELENLEREIEILKSRQEPLVRKLTLK